MNAMGCIQRRSMTPSLNCPLTVVNCRRPNSHRCSGIMIPTSSKVTLARAAAGPYCGGSN